MVCIARESKRGVLHVLAAVVSRLGVISGVVTPPSIVRLCVGLVRRDRVVGRASVDARDRFPPGRLDVLIPGALWRRRWFRRRVELARRRRFRDQLLVDVRVVVDGLLHRFAFVRLALFRLPAVVLTLLPIGSGSDRGLGSLRALSLPRAGAAVALDFFSVQVFAVLGRGRLCLPFPSLSIELGDRLWFWLDTVRGFVTDVPDAIAVCVGEVGGATSGI